MAKHRKLLRNNPYYILKLACGNIGAKFEPAWHYQHKKHPAFPDLISYRHVLSSQGIDSVLTQASIEELHVLPKPIIITTSLNGLTSFVVVDIDEKHIYVLNEDGEREPADIDFIKAYWNGAALIIDSDSKVNSKTKLNEKVDAFWKSLYLQLLLHC